MKRIYSVAISLLIFGFCCLPTRVFASCAGPFNLEEHFDMADAVVTGTVKGDFFGSYMKFQVDRYYKGIGPATIAVRGTESNTDITSVDYEIQTGQSYLLFLKKVDDLSYKTNICAGNKALERGSTTTFTAEEAAVLGSGSAPDTSANNAIILEDQLGWFMAIVGYGYVLPILLALSIAYLAYILYKFIRRFRIRNYQIALTMISGAYIVFYFYIQRVV